MIYALLAIAIVMVFSCLFGFCLHVFISKASRSFSDPDESDGHSCNTCRYEKVKPSDEPCCDCVTDDVDMWEAKN